MSTQTEPDAAGDGGEIGRAAVLLGGRLVLRRHLRDALDVHEALTRGLPRQALAHLVGKLRVLGQQDLLECGLGVSLRTSQRFKLAPDKPLSPEQSGRLWQFAEILAKATRVLGSQDAAERWLEQPAMALDRQRPIDLLATPAGTRLVEDLLGRIEFGVYT